MGKKSLTVGIILLFAFITCICGQVIASPAKELKYGHANAPTYPYHLGGEAFAKFLDEKSRGELKVKLHPLGQLGGEKDMTEGLQLGTIDFVASSLGVTATFIRIIDVLNLPFLFKGPEHFLKVMESDVGQLLLKKGQEEGEKVGLKLLAIAGPMFRVPMNNIRPIEKLEDFKGLRIRVMQVPIHMAAYKALGATPVPLAFGELYTALQTGVVDGNENGPATLVAMKFYEVQKYVSYLPVLSNGGVLLMSLKTWNKLNKDEQGLILEGAKVWAKTMNEEGLKQDKEALKFMEGRGLKVSYPKDLKPFVEACKPVYEEFLSKAPEEWRKIVEAIQKME
ncbi:MAG: TRAP transporter substrate-binding protein [Synergistetes bacterium]|nr:TRAP transporter substrate-binding protein [Synergistota bacterium]MDW8193174.1 TRAP transporter substrate-binding protein [Synergistota bacterium]